MINQKKSAMISGIVCFLILVFVLGLEAFKSQVREVQNIAEDYADLMVYVEYAADTEPIHIWQNEADGAWYFFLPSETGSKGITFGNLDSKDCIKLGENTFYRKDSIKKAISEQSRYSMQLCVGGNWLEEQEVVFLRQEKFSTVFINTASGTAENINADKTVKESAEARMFNAEGESEYVGALEYIRARGNSSFLETDKKSYQIKLPKQNSLYGMDKAKKWILQANAMDDTMIRNKLVYEFASKYTQLLSIQGEYVDLYLNGAYQGTYYLCEKIEVDKNRVNITDLEAKNEDKNLKEALDNGEQYVSEDGNVRAIAGLKNPEDITGGYLIERIPDWQYETTRCGFRTAANVFYEIVSPENATVEQAHYIRNLLNEMEIAIGEPDGVHPETKKHFSEYLDMDSWTSKYMLEEAFSDPDAPVGSMYLYKDSDSIDPLLYSGPVWDYDRAIGEYNIKYTWNHHLDDPKQIGYRGLYAEELLQCPEVMEQVKEKFQEWFVPYVEEKLHGEIQLAGKHVNASVLRDNVRWPDITGHYTDVEAADNWIEAFLQERMEFLTDVWLNEEQYHRVTFWDYDESFHDSYLVKHGECLVATPHVSSDEAIFAGWVDETGKAYDIRRPVLEDMTLHSEWIDIKILLQNGLGEDIDIGKVDVHELEILIEEIKRQQEEQGSGQ